MTAEEAQAVLDAREEARNGLLTWDETLHVYVSAERLASMAAHARRQTGTADPAREQSPEEMAEDILEAMFPQTGEALAGLFLAEGPS